MTDTVTVNVVEQVEEVTATINEDSIVVEVRVPDLTRLREVVAGSGIAVDNTDPERPVVSATGEATAAWGAITGDLAEQTDLQAALDGKQATHANLTAESGLTGAADRLSYYTGPGAKALATLTSFGRSVIAAVDAAAVKVLLSLGNVDNTSDTNKPISTATQTALDAKQATAQKGSANGYASLDSSAKVPTSQLPDAVLGALKFKGTWNANTNVITSSDLTINGGAMPSAASGNEGWYFIVSTAGATSEGGITDWKVGDWILSTGAAWTKIDNTDAVSSVNGQTGIVSLTTADVADSSNKRYITDAQQTVLTNTSGTNSGNETATTVGALINGATEKTTPADADQFAIADSAASNVLKKFTWANLVSAIASATATLTNKTITSLVLSAGGTGAGQGPLKFTAGSLLTSPEAGVYGYDGKVFYCSPTSGNRGIVQTTMFMRQTADFTASTATGGSGTKTFNESTNGAITLETGTLYEFEMQLRYTCDSTSATKSFGLLVGGGGSVSMFYDMFGAAIQADSNTGSMVRRWGTTAGVVSLFATNTGTGGVVTMRGLLQVTTGGTITPVFAQSANANFIFKAGSFIRITPLGTDTVAKQGNWS